MIIYTKDLSKLNFEALVNDPERLLEKVTALVPKWARCIPHITDNQLYFCACQLRGIITIPYKKRKAAVEHLCNNISLGGLTNVCVTLQEIIEVCDQESLKAMLEDFYEQNYA